MEWKRISGDALEWEREGTEVVGVYLGMEVNDNVDYSKQHLIETDKGIEKYWGTLVLDARLKNVLPGMIIKIVYLGKKPGEKGRAYHDFEVFYQKVGEAVSNDSDKTKN